MHRLFVNENSDLTYDCKYSLYKHIFNYEFNISFGYPRTDLSDTCDKQQAYLATAKANNDGGDLKKIKTENELYIRKADVFNTHLFKITQAGLAMQDQCDVAVIAIDYQKKSAPAFN